MLICKWCLTSVDMLFSDDCCCECTTSGYNSKPLEYNRTMDDVIIQKRLNHLNRQSSSTMQTVYPSGASALLSICSTEVSKGWVLLAPVVGYLASVVLAQ